MIKTAASNATEEFAMPDLCRALAEASPLATASVDGAAHIIRYVNPAFCLLIKKPREDLIGNEFCNVVPEGEDCLSLLGRVYQTGLAEIHIGQEYSDTNPFYWSYAMWPVLGTEDRIAGIIVQVTESKDLHEQATALNQALLISSLRQHELMDAADELNMQLAGEVAERKYAEEKMRRANVDLAQFAYAVSHDLQEPLRTVTSYTQLLARNLQPHLDSDSEQFVEYIVEGNRHMAALIKDMLAYAQAGDERRQRIGLIESSKAVERAVANLNATIKDTAATIDADPLPSVIADLPQLAQVFQNLIGNALKYRRADCTPRIHIAAQARGNEWVFSVQDNGIGFPPQYAEQIFGIFKRLHKEQYPGTGIGLAICKRIVERHHGSIWATGEAGKGATFFFTVPGKAAAAASA
jgi:signal transduction histidine kinase